MKRKQAKIVENLIKFEGCDYILRATNLNSLNVKIFVFDKQHLDEECLLTLEYFMQVQFLTNSSLEACFSYFCLIIMHFIHRTVQKSRPL